MKTKIIATIGPSSLDFDTFREIIKQGVDYVRINTAYSDSEQHHILFKNLERVERSEGRKIEVIYDIRNKEIIPELEFFQDYLIALSFTESAAQLKEVESLAPGKRVISKIESKRGLKNFGEVVERSWGVMVARGDLGIAVSLEKVPCAQKQLSKKTLEKNKFLIIATEMLLSMMKNPTPTRAEVSDVANAVFDNAGAVMLSEETAIGKYPVETVKYMKRVIEATEKCIKENPFR